MSRRRLSPLAIGLTFASALLLAAGASAQTIAGTVRSGATPVVGATIRLAELDRAVHSGSRGEFRLADLPRGTYHLYVTAIGFATASKSVDVAAGTAMATFDLSPSAVTLKEIVVTASPIARTDDDQYQSVSSKSFVELQNSAGTSFAEKISDLPGVTVRGNGTAPTRPILRGLGDNEVLVLENGLRMGDIATFDPAHATPIEAIGISRGRRRARPGHHPVWPEHHRRARERASPTSCPRSSDHRSRAPSRREGNTVERPVRRLLQRTSSAARTQAVRLSAGGRARQRHPDSRRARTRIPRDGATFAARPHAADVRPQLRGWARLRVPGPTSARSASASSTTR